MRISREVFGRTADGVAVDLYTLTNTNGLRVKIMTYGATIVAVETPDRVGRLANTTLALDSLSDYLHGHPCLGSTIGRYANRIAHGKFALDGVEYTLAVNNGPNHLHGGIKGFDKVVWRAAPQESPTAVGVRFTYISADGEEGYPGKLVAQVTYSLTNRNELKMEYAATTDKSTVVNLTNHAYWNLAGADASDVLAHEVTIHADKYLPVDDGLIPQGNEEEVAQTPMDFTTAHAIGAMIDRTAGGYDHCYVINRKRANELTLAATVAELKSGRVMQIYTTQPAIQFYTANGLDGSLTSHGRALQKHAGLCLETQHYPDSPHQPQFPSTRLDPGQTYEQVTIHTFDVR